MKYGLSDQQFRLIADFFANHSEVEKVILFGSRAMGNQKPASDIDLLICGTQVTPELVTQLAGLLNDELTVPFQFDLIRDSPELFPALKKHIEENGVVFYQK